MPTMTDGESLFDSRTTPSSGMGITAETFWRRPGVVRSTHPGGSFAAEGPRAEYICAPQPLSPPHGPDSPVGRVWELDGQVLLIGVTHGENTTMHLAEAIAQVPYSVSHPCVVGSETVMIAETDHCCMRFELADEWLRSVQRETRIANARVRLNRSRDIVDVAVAQLCKDPLIFLCSEGCEECALARASVDARSP
jgi:aminoglycoside 3-N-acetyltransferase